MNKIFGIILIIIGLNISVFSQKKDNTFILSLVVASEFNSQFTFSKETFYHFINNNIKINELNSNIHLNIVFYKVEILKDTLFKYFEKDCNEFIIGIILVPPYVLRLKGFSKNDYSELKEFLTNNKYKGSELLDIQIEAIDQECLKKAMKRARTNKRLRCLNPCGDLKVF